MCPFTVLRWGCYFRDEDNPNFVSRLVALMPALGLLAPQDAESMIRNRTFHFEGDLVGLQMKFPGSAQDFSGLPQELY